MPRASVVLFFAAVAVATCATLPVLASLTVEELEQYTFERYVAEYKKNYDTQEEYRARSQLFYDNLARIIAFNKEPGHSYELGLGPFTDLTKQEFIARHTGHASSDLTLEVRNAAHYSLSDFKAPDAFSWQDAEKPVLTAVKSQGGCGSCWAQAAVESLESMYAIHTGKLLNLSTQQVTSCEENPQKCGGTGGCNGSTPQLAWTYIKNAGGVALEADYPYLNEESEITRKCIQNETMKRVVNLVDFVNLPPNNYDAVIEALVTKGPLSVGVDATYWGHYSDGIFEGCGASGADIAINHAVQLVGYGTDNKTKKDYWIVRNSWGAWWGKEGYMHILRDKGTNSCYNNHNWTSYGIGCISEPNVSFLACGMCGILYAASYPNVLVEPEPNKSVWFAAAAFVALPIVITVMLILFKYCSCKKQSGEHPAVGKAPDTVRP